MAKNAPPHLAMQSLIFSYFVPHLISVAAKLELADHLEGGPRTVEDLAGAVGAQAPALYRLLRALASLGVFAETKGRKFKLTPLAATLQKSAPGSMRGAALLFSLRSLEEAWAQLLHGVQTGETPFLRANGALLFEYLKEHPEESAIFNEAMTGFSSTENAAIVAAYKSKFREIRALVDVGGGNGSLLAAILRTNPSLKGVLFEQPSVITQATQVGHLTVKDIAKRCTFESGDFFEAVPRGADAYLMKRTLHNWDDERCTKILANCRDAMRSKGRVLVVDAVIRPGNAPDRGKLLDMQMLVVMGGRERTKEEFAELFRQAGLELTRVVPTKCPLSIVEGVRA